VGQILVDTGNSTDMATDLAGYGLGLWGLFNNIINSIQAIRIKTLYVLWQVAISSGAAAGYATVKNYY